MPNDPFTLLKLPRTFAVDLDAVERRYRALQKALHPDRFMQASASERQLSMQKAMDVNEAYRALKDPLRRAEALLAAQSGAAETSAERERRTSDGAMMFEMMELQEALSDAKDGSAEQLAAAATAIDARYRSQLQRLEQAFDESAAAQSDCAQLVDGLRYLTRLRSEAQRLLRKETR